MAAIETMIARSWDWLQTHRALSRHEEAWLAATRLHALLDAYEAVGGNDDPWRNEAKVLRKD
jgi:hypothetical protein